MSEYWEPGAITGTCAPMGYAGYNLTSTRMGFDMWVTLLGLVLAVATGFFLEHLPFPRWASTRPSEQAVTDWRLGNQGVLAEGYFQAFFYGATYFLLLMAIVAPVGSVTHQMNADLDLSTTRLHLNKAFDPNTAMEMAGMLALLLHLFLWRGAIWATDHIKQWLDPIASLSPLKYGAIASLLIGAVALLIAGNFYYLMDPNADYIRSIMMPFIVVGFALMMVAALTKR